MYIAGRFFIKKIIETLDNEIYNYFKYTINYIYRY